MLSILRKLFGADDPPSVQFVAACNNFKTLDQQIQCASSSDEADVLKKRQLQNAKVILEFYKQNLQSFEAQAVKCTTQTRAGFPSLEEDYLLPHNQCDLKSLVENNEDWFKYEDLKKHDLLTLSQVLKTHEELTHQRSASATASASSSAPSTPPRSQSSGSLASTMCWQSPVSSRGESPVSGAETGRPSLR